jgi:hypothetical protein
MMNQIVAPATVTVLGSLKLSIPEILRGVPFAENDVVVVTGTLIEGIGTPHSDIDVYVICDKLPTSDQIPQGTHMATRDPQGRVTQIFDYLDDHGLAIDIEYWTKDTVNQKIAYIDQRFRHLCKSSFTVLTGIDGTTSDLLHKLSVGLCVNEPEQFQNIMSKFDRRQFCYIQYRSSCGALWDLRDLQGYWKTGDWNTGLLATRDFLVTQMGGLTLLTGYTNSKRKWIFRRLEKIDPKYRHLTSRFTELISRAADTDEMKKETIRQSFDLVDLVWDAFREIIDASNFYPDTQKLSAMLEQEFRVKEVSASVARSEGFAPDISRAQTRFQYLFRRKYLLGDGPPLRSYLD